MIKFIAILFLSIGLMSDTYNCYSSYQHERCIIVLNRANINIHIKSSKGWKRAIFQKKLKLYIRNKHFIYTEELENCLIKESFQISNYNRGVGKQK